MALPGFAAGGQKQGVDSESKMECEVGRGIPFPPSLAN